MYIVRELLFFNAEAMEWLMFSCFSLDVDINFWLLPLCLATAQILRPAGSTNNSLPTIQLTTFRKITFASLNTSPL